MAFANNAGVSLYWEDGGEGDPLLLIMGLGYGLEMWHRSRPLLERRFRVIAFDNRGVGRSDVTEPGFTIRDMAKDAEAVLDAAEVECAHVFGVSMGGVIAQELALSSPDRVRSLVLGCTSCGGPGAVPADPEVVQALVARAQMSVEEGVRVMIPFVYDANTSQDLIDQDLELRMRTYPSEKGYVGQLQAVIGYETWDRLDAISVPTLVIHGRSDRLIPHVNGEVLAAAIPGARLVSLENASHIFSTDQPDATSDALLSFFDEVAPMSARS